MIKFLVHSNFKKYRFAGDTIFGPMVQGGNSPGLEPN